LLHDLGHLLVEFVNERPGWVIDDLREALQADTALTDVTVEKSDADDDVRKFAQLSNLLWRGEGDEGSQAGTRKDTLEGGRYLTLYGVGHSCSQLNRGIVAQDVLLVLVQ
jgi:hypothetical protein